MNNDSRNLYTANNEELIRLDGMIEEEENNIEDYYKRIGELYASLHCKDEPFEADYLPLMTALMMSKERIKAIKNRKLALSDEVKADDVQTTDASVKNETVGFAEMTAEEPPAEEEGTSTERVEEQEDVCSSVSETDAEAEDVPCAAEKAPSSDDASYLTGSVVPAAIMCRYCGAVLETDSLFCTECGKQVDKQELQAEASEAEPFEETESAPEESLQMSEGMNYLHVAEALAATAEPSGRMCRCCGAVLEPGSLFCTECGKPVDEQKDEDTSAESNPDETSCDNENSVGDAEADDRENAVKICQFCGTVLEPDCLFCTECGSKLSEENEETSSENFTEAFVQMR